MSTGVAGTRIVVTGGASGMGAALVRAYAQAGANVATLDRDVESGTAVAREAGGTTRFFACDVTDKTAVDDSFAAAAAFLGGLDTLVHAAGLAPGAPAESIELAVWETVFAVNARGTFLTNQAAFRLLEAKGGRILNFASGAGVTGLPNKAHYAATKGAVIAWTRTIAKEWGRFGITANMILPAIRTPMYELTRSLMSEEQLAIHDTQIAATMPIDGRLGDPARDLVPLMLFLSGDGARFLTGQMYAVDGGLLMVR